MATATEITSPTKELDPGMMIRRALFLLVLVLLTFYFLKSDFKGLSSPLGMDQAQIARTIARGEKYYTKCIRPVALAQVNQHLKMEDEASTGVSLMQMPDTFHAPLNPMLNAMVLSINKDLWTPDPSVGIYAPDILIAGASMVLLLASIGVTYLLISRIFDTRIGGVTAFLMLMCELLWRYSQSGLPQMLMLFLFSFATYFLYKAVENQQQAKPVFIWILMAGGFFALLALSHWLTVWIFLGLLAFGAFYFTPKGVHTVILVAIFLLITGFWARHNYVNSGDVMGVGRYLLFSGMAQGSDTALLRDFEQKSGMLNFNGFPTKVATNFIAQFVNLYGYLGSIIVAPLFFLSLLHPFRRKEIADFRWCVFSMWGFATLGMCIFDIKPYSEEKIGSNNLHVLFIPLFTGYGLAFLSVLWNRLNLPMHQAMMRNGHFILAVLLSSFPFMMNLVIGLRQSTFRDKNPARNSHYPYYFTAGIASLHATMGEKEVIFTDIPWATAWYADRVSIWIPKNRKQFDEISKYARDKNEDAIGIMFTPTSMNAPFYSSIHAAGAENEAWQELILRLPVSERTGSMADTMANMPDFQFKQPAWLWQGSMLYTDEQHLKTYYQDRKKAQEK